MPDVQNIHGRKPGRGLRPWLLIPKYICVSLILGGLFAAGMLCASASALPPEARGQLWILIGSLFRYQIVPCVLVTLVLGIILFLQHPREFLCLRWLQLKVILVVIAIPLSHWILSTQLQRLKQNTSLAPADFVYGLAGTMLVFFIITILGRLKPRLTR